MNTPAHQHRLVLFDVDGTLISSSGAGIRAMADAGRGLHGDQFTTDGVEFAGRLDPLIIHDVLGHNGIEASERNMHAFRRAYHDNLPERLRRHDAESLPGVAELLDALAREQGVVLGLLTGNFEDSGRTKLDACGIDADRFSIRVWGDHATVQPPTRDDLPRVAMRRLADRLGGSVDPAAVAVVGDTPHDVRCASVNGCRSLAVATGRYTADELTAAGASLVVETLVETDRIVQWITSINTTPTR